MKKFQKKNTENSFSNFIQMGNIKWTQIDKGKKLKSDVFKALSILMR